MNTLMNSYPGSVKTVLVTGGAGFVGHHLVNRLLEEGVRVHVLDDLSTGNVENIPKEATFFQGDIRDAGMVRRAMANCDGVFHLAARVELQKSLTDPVDCFSVNVVGTAQIIQECLAVENRRLVFASSCAVYPLHPDQPLSETMAILGETPYALSKRVGEQHIEIYAEIAHLNACSLRCFNIYGPGQKIDSPYAAVIPKFIHQALHGKEITVNGKGDQTRDFIYISDVTDGYMLAMASQSLGIFNLGGGNATSIRQLAEMVTNLVGPNPISFQPALSRDASSSQANIESIRQHLKFSPCITLEEGLANTIHYLKARMT